MGPNVSPQSSSPLPLPDITSAISVQINAATRRQHAKLNALIIDRLGLALPPNARDPRLLGYGLAAFARIFFTFETAWEDLILAEASASSAEKHDDPNTIWLTRLRVQGLERSSRLRDDLAFISSRSQSSIDDILPAQRVKLEKMATSIHENPHVLFAYAWVMYMATFSGGRWIRQQLYNAGPQFWVGADQWPGRKAEAFVDRGIPGFSFLSFVGNEDGEDIKTEFKSRLREAEVALTQEQREDIIIAAGDLFEYCTELVLEIDRAVRWQGVLRKSSSLVFLGVALLAFLCVLFGRRLLFLI